MTGRYHQKLYSNVLVSAQWYVETLKEISISKHFNVPKIKFRTYLSSLHKHHVVVSPFFLFTFTKHYGYYMKPKTLNQSSFFTVDVCFCLFGISCVPYEPIGLILAVVQSWSSTGSIGFACLVFVFLTLWPILMRHEFLLVLLLVRSKRYFEISSHKFYVIRKRKVLYYKLS